MLKIAIVVLVGWLQAGFGAKRLWLTGLAVFLFGSVLCAFAWNIGSLIVFRAVQGAGGGVLLPLMATMVMQAARGQNLGKLMATVSLPAALGPILQSVAQTASSQSEACDMAFWWACGFAFVAVAFSVVLPGKNRGRTTETQPERGKVNS